MPQRIPFIDSHTGGEPTRVILGSIPDLGSGSVAERARVFAEKYDDLRALMVTEPRGSDILVGALWLPPNGVIFFNNVGLLGMCGHGTIGLIHSLKFLGKIAPGEHRLETPVGEITATLHPDGRVSVRNVPSYVWKSGVELDVPGYGTVTGEIAWGGNWFFLVHDCNEELTVDHVERLTHISRVIRDRLESQGITGADGGVIDHIELGGPPKNTANHGRNFVLCPGLAYDRSPCGTGTSAKLACLAKAGKLRPGEVWKQESVTGSVFEGVYEAGEGHTIWPTITGTASVTAIGDLVIE